MNHLPQSCLAMALAVALPLLATTAQAQGTRGQSDGSSLYSPPGGDTGKATPPATRTDPAKADAGKGQGTKAPSTGQASQSNQNPKAGSNTKAAGNTKATGNAKAAPEPRRSIALALTGRWRDANCIPMSGGSGAGGPMFVQRAYEFDEKAHTWTMSGSVYGSDRCSADSRLMTYEGSGSYEITGRSRVGNNVYEATFTMKNWQATSTSREGTLALFNARCGSGVFDEGRALDLNRSGCSLVSLQPLTVVDTGRELLRFDEDRIYLGPSLAVPNQGADRPSRVSTFALTRL